MDATDIGAQLRSSREALGLSVASLAQRTRVQPRIISAIEQNDLLSIPPKPYGRGFLRAYAREVGLDPEQTVHDYFAQFAPSPSEPKVAQQPQPWPVRGSGLLTAGLVVAVLVLLASFQGNSTDALNTRGSDAIGTSGIGAEPAPAASVGTATPTGAPSQRHQPAARAGSALVLVLEAQRECWVAARADGERVVYELMKPGAKHTIHAEEEVLLRAGDAGALRVTVNGRSTAPFGADGEVRTMRITPETASR